MPKANVIECDQYKAHKLLKDGEYKMVGNYVKEVPCIDDNDGVVVGYVDRQMLYCFVKKEHL